MLEKIDPFVWNDENDRSCGKLKPHEVIDIKLKLAYNVQPKKILEDYDFISPSMLSKMRIGRAYQDILPELNDTLMDNKRARTENDPEFIKEIYDYYKDHPGISDKDVSVHFKIPFRKAEGIRRMIPPFDEILKVYGYEPILYHPTPKKASPELVAKIKEMLSSKEYSISAIAKELGVSRDLVQDILYHRGAYVNNI